MAFRLNNRPGLFQAILACIAGAIVFIAMPFLTFGIVLRWESMKPSAVNGSVVYVVSDNWGVLMVFVVWLFMVFLAISLSIGVYLAKKTSSTGSGTGDAIVLALMTCFSILSIVVITIATVLVSLELLSKCVMIGGAALSLAGLAISYGALRKIAAIARATEATG